MSEPIEPWAVESEEVVFAAAPWLSVVRQRIALPGGGVIPDFYRVDVPDFALVVPVTAAGGVVLVRGYRHGTGTVTLNPPGGMLNPGEDPLSAAKRELLEETGHAADDWRHLGCYPVDANRRCGAMHLYTARNARPVGPANPDTCEQLEVVVVERGELAGLLLRGEIGGLAGAGAVAIALLAGASASEPRP